MKTNGMEVSEKKATYGFSMNSEVKKILIFWKMKKQKHIVNKKGDIEECKFRGLVFEEKIFQHPSIIILTNKRLIFFKHYFFKPDKMFYLPLDLISKINIRKLSLFGSASRAIECNYSNKSILFAIGKESSKIIDSARFGSNTIELFKFLKIKLKNAIVENKEISTKSWDVYLIIVGIFIGSYVIGGIIPTLIFVGIGNLVGLGLNRILK